MSLPKILLHRANRPALRFSPNDSIGSCSTGGHLEISSINNKRTTRVFIRFLAYFLEANLSSTSLPSIFWKYSKTFHQQPENIQRLFINNPKIFKDFFACKFVLAANHQQPENIQRLLRLQLVLAANHQQSESIQRRFRLHLVLAANHQLYPGIIQRLFGQQQSTTATSNSKQQQQSAAAINSSNQQQQPAAAISSGNQQQQPTGTINISNNQLSSYQQYLRNPRRLPLVTNTVPSRDYALLEVDLGLAARLRVQPPLPRLAFVIFHFSKNSLFAIFSFLLGPSTNY